MLCYFTTQAPHGPGESFVLREIDTCIELGEDILIIPIRPKHEEQTKYNTWVCKAWSLKAFLYAFAFFFLHPLAVTRVFLKVLLARNQFKHTIRNLVLFPKALATSFYLRDKSVDHIHAHWLATTSTVAMVVAELLSIPWSCTGHRFDVYTKNMFREKVKSSRFIRLIDEKGYQHFTKHVPKEYRDKVLKIHLGVNVPPDPPTKVPNRSMKFIMPASFIGIKGHSYVILAFDRLVRTYSSQVELDLYGQGPLEDQMKTMVNELGLSNNIHFCGLIPNDELLDKYKQNEYRALLLPSLDLGDGEHEGIPVSLMEAMAYGLTVVSCLTGGIGELLNDDNAYLAEPQNVSDIVRVLIDLLNDSGSTQYEKALHAYKTVQDSFNTYTNTEELLSLMKSDRH